MKGKYSAEKAEMADQSMMLNGALMRVVGYLIGDSLIKVVR